MGGLFGGDPVIDDPRLMQERGADHDLVETFVVVDAVGMNPVAVVVALVNRGDNTCSW